MNTIYWDLHLIGVLEVKSRTMVLVWVIIVLLYVVGVY